MWILCRMCLQWNDIIKSHLIFIFTDCLLEILLEVSPSSFNVREKLWFRSKQKDIKETLWESKKPQFYLFQFLFGILETLDGALALKGGNHLRGEVLPLKKSKKFPIIWPHLLVCVLFGVLSEVRKVFSQDIWTMSQDSSDNRAIGAVSLM